MNSRKRNIRGIGIGLIVGMTFFCDLPQYPEPKSDIEIIVESESGKYREKEKIYYDSTGNEIAVIIRFTYAYRIDSAEVVVIEDNKGERKRIFRINPKNNDTIIEYDTLFLFGCPGEREIVGRIWLDNGKVKEKNRRLNILPKAIGFEEIEVGGEKIIESLLKDNFNYKKVVGRKEEKITFSVRLKYEDECNVLNINEDIIKSGEKKEYKLNYGRNTFEIKSVQSGKDSIVYHIDIIRDGVYLDTLFLSCGKLMPSFNEDSMIYKIELEEKDSVVEITGRGLYNGVKVVIGKDSVERKTFTFGKGRDSIDIIVISEEGEKRIYKIYVERKKSGEARLKEIKLSSGTLIPDFNKDVFKYSVVVENGENETLTIKGIPFQEGASVRINGKEGGEEKIVLEASILIPVTIEVTSEDGEKRNRYELLVIKKADDKDYLHTIEIDKGILRPSFHPESLKYEVRVGREVDSIKLKVRRANKSQEVKIDGTKVDKDTFIFIPVVPGINEKKVEIEVISEDGRKRRIYEITLNRAYCLQISGEGEGVIEPQGEMDVFKGEEVEIVAKAKEGSHLVKWIVDSGSVIIKERSKDSIKEIITVILQEGNGKIKGIFEKNSYNLTLVVIGGGEKSRVVGPPNNLVKHGEEVIIKAIPGKGYKFKRWRLVSGNAEISHLDSIETRVKVYDGSVKIEGIFEAIDEPSSKLPLKIIANNTNICRGDSVILKAFCDTMIEEEIIWEWYEASGSKTVYIGSGDSIVVAPLTSKEYFLHRKGAKDTSEWASTQIIVNYPSQEPDSIIADKIRICKGDSVLLKICGGFLGTDARWKWYVDTFLINTPMANNNHCIIKPESTTTYYVRAEGICNVTPYKSITIFVNTPPVPPDNVSPSSLYVCPNSKVTLQVNGKINPSAGEKWKWFSDTCGKNLIDSGSSTIEVLAGVSGEEKNYYVRVEGPCGCSECKSATIIVRPLPPNPQIISPKLDSICVGTSTILKVYGTIDPKSAAQWKWYSGSCESGSLVGIGEQVEVKPTATTKFYVRAESECYISSWDSAIVKVITPSTITGISPSTNVTICQGKSTTLSVNGTLSSGAYWQWYNGSNCSGTKLGTGAKIEISKGGTYSVRAEGGICPSSNCYNVTVTVNTSPYCPYYSGIGKIIFTNDKVLSKIYQFEDF